MKTKKITLFSLLLFAVVSLFLSSCSKDNTEQVRIIDRPKISRTIDYSVIVVAGETAASYESFSKSAKETTGATGAIVQVSVGGKVLSRTTDASGQATFTKLTAGLAAVTVTLTGHTTVNYVVNLYHVDSVMYDNEKSRIASTKVVVFPTTGTGMITVTGLVSMQSNIAVTFQPWAAYNVPYTQSPELEYAPANTAIVAVVDNHEFSKYVTMRDGGVLTDVTYEGVTFTGVVDASGVYSISVPSTAMGLAIKILPQPVATNVTYSVTSRNPADGTIQTNATTNNYILTTRTARYVFRSSGGSISAYTGKNEVLDITYNNPIIIDSDYFGSTAYIP